jgi:enoyl-CoA hydratase
MSDEVRYEVTGSTAVITINRPQVRNAINEAVVRGLTDAMSKAERSKDVAVVILTGEGDKAFSAGADLNTVAAGKVADLSTADGGFAGFVRLPRSIPVIAAVNGAALAGGCEIVLACDIVIAVDEARFGLPEVRHGLIAAAGGLFRLPRAIPRTRAAELILTGGSMTAAEARELGLVNHVVSRPELLKHAQALAQQIAQNAPLAVRQSLGVLHASEGLPEQRCWKISEDSLACVVGSRDVIEGARAFVEKRPPNWTESWSPTSK